jgi:hypothetical protein
LSDDYNFIHDSLKTWKNFEKKQKSRIIEKYLKTIEKRKTTKKNLFLQNRLKRLMTSLKRE